MTLTDQSEPQAKHAVASIVGHLCNLQNHAAWFREDAGLRERAIAETLLFGTGLSDNVASQHAQYAWQRQHESRPPAVVRRLSGVPPAG
jgi:hypothetical protein